MGDLQGQDLFRIGVAVDRAKRKQQAKEKQNIMSVLKRHSVRLKEKLRNDPSLTFDDLTPLEQAKYKAAKQIVSIGEGADTKDQFDKFRRENEAGIVKEAQKILNDKFVKSLVDKGPVEASFTREHRAVQTTLRKIDEWADLELVNDLKQSDVEAYEQFLFDVHMMGGKRTKKDVQTSLRRAMKDPLLTMEEKARERQNSITQYQIDHFANKIQDSLMVAGLKKDGHSFDNAKRVAEFLLIHMPETAAHILDDIKQKEQGRKNQEELAQKFGHGAKGTVSPRVVYNGDNKNETLSRQEKLLALLGKRMSTNDSDFEKDVIFANILLTKKEKSSKLATLILKASQRVDNISGADAFVFSAQTTNPVPRAPSVTPESKTAHSSHVRRAPVRASKRPRVQTPTKKSRRFTRLRRAMSSLAAAFALAVMPQATGHNIEAGANILNTAALLPSSTVPLASVPESISIAPIQQPSPTVDTVTGDVKPTPVAIAIGTAPKIISVAPVVAEMPKISENKTYKVRAEDPAPAISGSPKHPFSEVVKPMVPQIQPPQTQQEKFAQGVFGFDDIPAVIQAYYAEQGVKIPRQLQRQFELYNEGIERSYKGRVEQTSFEMIKIATQKFGSDFLNSHGYKAAELIEAQEGKRDAKRLTRNAVPYWKQKYAPKPSV